MNSTTKAEIERLTKMCIDQSKALKSYESAIQTLKSREKRKAQD